MQQDRRTIGATDRSKGLRTSTLTILRRRLNVVVAELRPCTESCCGPHPWYHCTEPCESLGASRHDCGASMRIPSSSAVAVFGLTPPPLRACNRNHRVIRPTLIRPAATPSQQTSPYAACTLSYCALSYATHVGKASKKCMICAGRCSEVAGPGSETGTIAENQVYAEGWDPKSRRRSSEA